MSGPNNPVSGIDELRRRFAIWSLAIFGSLTGSGAVQLESRAWAADEPPTEAKEGQEKKEAGSARAFDRTAFMQQVQAKEFEAAIAMLESLPEKPVGNNIYMHFILANGMLNARHDEGPARMEEVIKRSQAELKADDQVPSVYSMARQSQANRLMAERKSAEALTLVENTIKELKQENLPQATTLENTLISLLIREGRLDEAKDMSSQRLASAISTAKEKPSVNARTALRMAFSQFSSSFAPKFPEENRQAYAAIEPLLREAVESESAALVDYMTYQSVQSSFATSIAESDHESALNILKQTQELADKLKERLSEADQNLLTRQVTALRSAENRIKSKMLHTSLIGQPAPELEIEAVVNMSKVTMADLKGKVVLIDFWAVWCGPCIATFPHLQEWRRQYGDKGLVIIGVTKQYGYRWDKEQGEHVSDKTASLDVELEMLEEFRKAHELEHGFVVTPQGSEYSSKFGVVGIPQAVLVDQNGAVQMIKVGSGEQNAHDLEEKIKSLLGV